MSSSQDVSVPHDTTSDKIGTDLPYPTQQHPSPRFPRGNSYTDTIFDTTPQLPQKEDPFLLLRPRTIQISNLRGEDYSERCIGI
jgi:hypothetical protein